MFKKFACAVTVAAGLAVSGCASVPMASPEADKAAKGYTVDSAKANLYIYRNETFGAAIRMPVAIDSASVGETASKTYIFKQVEPGSHVITSQKDESSLTVDAQAGQNYFVWQEVKMGAMSASSKLQLVDEAKGKAGVAECKLVQ